MATDRCVGCNTSNDLRTLILGEKWIDFCYSCGNKETVINSETGEEITLNELYERDETKTLAK